MMGIQQLRVTQAVSGYKGKNEKSPFHENRGTHE